MLSLTFRGCTQAFDDHVRVHGIQANSASVREDDAAAPS